VSDPRSDGLALNACETSLYTAGSKVSSALSNTAAKFISSSDTDIPHSIFVCMTRAQVLNERDDQSKQIFHLLFLNLIKISSSMV
jgi:hypothetical protein